MEEMGEELAHRLGVPNRHDQAGLPQNPKTVADLFSGIPE
ncbi:hypothetical protein EDD64_10288 [Effusibacillus lacus]|nr:hypothetical protein EDD64_10288 [Effusibacillus lacus]